MVFICALMVVARTPRKRLVVNVNSLLTYYHGRIVAERHGIIIRVSGIIASRLVGAKLRTYLTMPFGGLVVDGITEPLTRMDLSTNKKVHHGIYGALHCHFVRIYIQNVCCLLFWVGPEWWHPFSQWEHDIAPTACECFHLSVNTAMKKMWLQVRLCSAPAKRKVTLHRWGMELPRSSPRCVR